MSINLSRIHFREAWSRFWPKNIFPIVLLTMLQQGIRNKHLKFEGHLLSHKQVTEHTIL